MRDWGKVYQASCLSIQIIGTIYRCTPLYVEWAHCLGLASFWLWCVSDLCHQRYKMLSSLTNVKRTFAPLVQNSNGSLHLWKMTRLSLGFSKSPPHYSPNVLPNWSISQAWGPISSLLGSPVISMDCASCVAFANCVAPLTYFSFLSLSPHEEACSFFAVWSQC